MTDDYFGKSDSKWDWKKFSSTEGFPVSPDLMDWIIGQDKAVEECKLCLDEWMHKLGWLKKKKWWEFWKKAETFKPQKARERLPAGPFLLLLGDAGTGKSLLGMALASHLNKLYKKNFVDLFDVVCWANKTLPSEPKISISPSPEGRTIVRKLKKKAAKKNRFTKWGFRILQGLMIGFGMFIIGFLLYFMFHNWIANEQFWTYVNTGDGLVWTELPLQEYWSSEGGFIAYIANTLMVNAQLFYLGIGALSMGAMLFIFKNLIGRFAIGKKGIGGAEATEAPKLIVDNSDGQAKFIDATGHSSPQLFGSVAWDPYQTGGLGTPEHQRVTAGDVHRAFMGILYIDEIKNLVGQEAITLLTVLEDGQLPIAMRSKWRGGGTSAMAISTEPVPCMTFLVAAGNMDSVPQIHHALMDRIRGYGKLVYMNNDMANTVENRRKYVQFITQEISRFNLLPFSRDSCIEIIEEARRASGRKNRLTCLFRPMISIIKTASILAINEEKTIVQPSHVKEAMDEHCKSIHRQVLERIMEQQDVYKVIDPNAEPIIGQIYGVAVASFHYEGGGMVNEKMGEVLPIRASVIKCDPRQSYFEVTGVNTESNSWIQSSVAKVGHVILDQMFEGKSSYKIHIDFAQSHKVDGPSAGVAMALAVFSAVSGKPIRQDTALTGELNLRIDGKVIVTPVGQIHEKILAAERWGFKRVCIPKTNYDSDIIVEDYNIEIISCSTLQDYINAMIVDEEGKIK